MVSLLFTQEIGLKIITVLWKVLSNHVKGKRELYILYKNTNNLQVKIITNNTVQS